MLDLGLNGGLCEMEQFASLTQNGAALLVVTSTRRNDVTPAARVYVGYTV